jgi:3-oxoadipate enol-lactonase
VRKALAANDPRSLKHAIHSVVVNRPDRRQLFRRIVAPTIVVGGEEDGVFPPHEQEKLAEAIPGARLVVVPGVAHLVALEAPDTVNVMLSELVENGAVRG